LISLIAAVAENGVIGRDNGLPWRLPADLQRFRRLTLGKPVIMGRRTWESLGRPLPQRLNIVLSRRPPALPAGVVGAAGPAAALAAAGGAAETMVIGGAEIYRLFLPLAGRLHLTRIHRSVAGDTRFPPFDEAAWREVARERHAGAEFDYSFVDLERRAAA
jgi:dihydrofolate reductase